MAYLTQVATNTLSNQNISSALLVLTYTNTTRIRKLLVNVFIDQLAGGGDYKASLTIQRAGAGSAYQSTVTTNTLAAGVTAGYFGSIPITLNATDVLKVYVTGLAGDTTTPDIIVDVNEEWANIDANGRVDLGAWLGSVPDALSSGLVQAIAAAAGAIAWTYTLTSTVDGSPIADADVWVTTDVGGANVIASGKTDAYGQVTFYLDAGTIYVWRQKSGWDFVNPDTEVVS